MRILCLAKIYKCFEDETEKITSQTFRIKMLEVFEDEGRSVEC